MNQKEIKKTHPRPCPVCGEYEIVESYEICHVCGYEDDYVEHLADLDGGPNKISYSQYKSVWEKNKEKIRNFDNPGAKGHLVVKLFEEQK